MNVFVSYAAEDRKHAERLVAALERDGVEVWWDANIRPGQVWDRTINEALSRADATVVIFSRHALESDWVRSEALAAFDETKLRIVLIDDVKLPAPFNVVQFVDLSHWRGWPHDSSYRSFLESLLPGEHTRRSHLPALALRTFRTLGLAGVPFLLAWSAATDDLERIYLHGRVFTIAAARVELRDVAVLPLPRPPKHEAVVELRRQYPRVLSALRERGVREVFFDLSFRQCHPDPAVDQAFAAAIDGAVEESVVVAFGVPLRAKTPDVCPALAASKAKWVGVEFLRDEGLTYTVRFADPVVDMVTEAGLSQLWHAGVALAAARHGVSPTIDGHSLQLGPLSTPLSGGLLPLSPIRVPSSSELLAWPDAGDGVRGKIVVIGDVEKDRVLSLDGSTPGPVVHAGLIQTLLDGRVPRDARRTGASLLTIASGVVAIAVTRFSRVGRRAAAGVTLVALLGIVALLAANAVFVTVAPACVAAWLATRFAPRVSRSR